MRLVPVSLTGRRFLIQFTEIMDEFGSVIPWLDGMNDLRFATNGSRFRDQLLRRTKQEDGEITPYQFVLNDELSTFTGGILHFSRSPEQLHDRQNLVMVERLTAQGASFISCLQVRNPHRRTGIGKSLMQRSLKAILKEHGSVWGVVSDYRLLPWYRSLGAELHSKADNRDRLWIVQWTS